MFDQPPAASMPENPDFVVLTGKRFRDGWISPYISIAVKGIAESCEGLRLTLFRPAIADTSNVTQTVLVRSRLQTLDTFEFTDRNAQSIVRNISLGAIDMREPFVVSIRVSPRARPALPDQRMLGVVLVDVGVI